jgi:hypothetical protein
MRAALSYIGSIVLLDLSLHSMNGALSLLASRSSSAEPGFIRFLLLFYFFFLDFLFLSVSWRTHFGEETVLRFSNTPVLFLHDFVERYELTLLFNPSQQPLFSILLSIFVWWMTV